MLICAILFKLNLNKIRYK